jgi:hypothetical protein
MIGYPAPLRGDFDEVIMIAVGIEEMGRSEFLPPPRLEESSGCEAQTTHESEMAFFSECMQQCFRKVLDTVNIVRDGDLSPPTSIRQTAAPAVWSTSGGTLVR